MADGPGRAHQAWRPHLLLRSTPQARKPELIASDTYPTPTFGPSANHNVCLPTAEQTTICSTPPPAARLGFAVRPAFVPGCYCALFFFHSFFSVGLHSAVPAA